MGFLTIILKHVPSGWIEFLQEEEVDGRGISLRHPNKPGVLFDFVITKERMGVAVLKDSEAEIELDLGGFSFSFENEEMDRFASFKPLRSHG